MTVILTSPLKRALPELANATDSKNWCDIAGDFIHQGLEDILVLIGQIENNITILEHQKTRTAEIIGILEEAGGLVIRSRNHMTTPSDVEKYKDKIKEFQDMFSKTLLKLDVAVAASTVQDFNLLNGDSLITPFDPKGANKLTTEGMKLTSDSLGIRAPDFSNLITLQNARIDVMNAIDIAVTLRNIIAESVSSLSLSRDFACEAITLMNESMASLPKSQLSSEIGALEKLRDIGKTIIGDESLAEPPQQEILASFAATPHMEEI